MGRKDASTIKLPVDQYRKQIGKQWIIFDTLLWIKIKTQLCILRKYIFSNTYDTQKYMSEEGLYRVLWKQN